MEEVSPIKTSGGDNSYRGRFGIQSASTHREGGAGLLSPRHRNVDEAQAVVARPRGTWLKAAQRATKHFSKHMCT